LKGWIFLNNSLLKVILWGDKDALRLGNDLKALHYNAERNLHVISLLTEHVEVEVCEVKQEVSVVEGNVRFHLGNESSDIFSLYLRGELVILGEHLQEL